MDDRTIERLDTLSPQEKRALLARIYSGKVQKPRTAPLSFAQERFWFLDQLEPGNFAYNRPLAIRLSGSLDVTVLEKEAKGEWIEIEYRPSPQSEDEGGWGPAVEGVQCRIRAEKPTWPQGTVPKLPAR